jgi:aspartyl/asparaginyl-tRNA synthetase
MATASQRVFIETVPSFVQQEIAVRGWVSRIRILGKTVFVVLKDCSGEVQCVAAPESVAEHHLKLEDTVEIVGRVRQEARAKLGYELDISRVRVLSRSGQRLPFTSFSNLDSVNPDTLVEYRPLALRNEAIGSVFRIQAAVLRLFREFLTQRQFTEIVTSKLVSSGTEGGTNLFEVKYFDRVAYLAQSPQFYKEHAVAGLERVFETGHVYRAEPHATSRHLWRGKQFRSSLSGSRDHDRGPTAASSRRSRKALRGRQIDPSNFESHLKMFDLGMPPHGGFAIGLERLTAQVLNLPNVRQASLYPRDRTKLTP